MRKIITIMLVALMLCAPLALAGSVGRTMFDSVATTGTSSTVDVSEIDTKTIYLVATDATTGGTLLVQTSYDGTSWATILTQAVSTGVTEIGIVGLYHKFIRLNLSARTDGTYSAYLFGKN